MFGPPRLHQKSLFKSFSRSKTTTAVRSHDRWNSSHWSVLNLSYSQSKMLSTVRSGGGSSFSHRIVHRNLSSLCSQPATNSSHSILIQIDWGHHIAHLKWATTAGYGIMRPQPFDHVSGLISIVWSHKNSSARHWPRRGLQKFLWTAPLLLWTERPIHRASKAILNIFWDIMAQFLLWFYI